MKWSESTEYGYALGRVRALEPYLLDRPRYERLIGAADAQQFAALLTDVGYGRFAGQRADTQELLAAAWQDNSAFFARYCRRPEVLLLFFLPHDLNRLKALLKRSFGAEAGPAAGTSAAAGGWSQQQLDALATAQGTAQPALLRQAIAGLLASPETAAPRAVDSILDVAGWQYLVLSVGEAPFLRALVALRADTANLRALVRSRALDEQAADLAAGLLPGGTLEHRALLAARGADWDGLVAAFRNSQYGELLAAGVDFLRERRSLSRLERLAREEEIRFLRQTRYVAFGYEPLLAFCLLREAEITNLRLLYAAKLAGMSDDSCREVVAYVN